MLFSGIGCSVRIACRLIRRSSNLSSRGRALTAASDTSQDESLQDVHVSRPDACNELHAALTIEAVDSPSWAWVLKVFPVRLDRQPIGDDRPRVTKGFQDGCIHFAPGMHVVAEAPKSPNQQQQYHTMQRRVPGGTFSHFSRAGRKAIFLRAGSGG